jgi:hypothetical protein
MKADESGEPDGSEVSRGSRSVYDSIQIGLPGAEE